MITIINGHVQQTGNNASGATAGIAIPNGSIKFQLNVDATVIASPGGFVASDSPITFQFDQNGNLVQPCLLWSNAELNPQNSLGLGTYYLVTLYDQNGAAINQVPMWWQFTESSGTQVDISTMTAYAVTGGNVIFYPSSFQIPTPTATSLGGVYSNAGATSQWIRAINTNGSVTLSQPAFSDISGTISASQLPNPMTFTNLTASGLITAQGNIQLGVAGTTSGLITLEGSTSGSCTITAPAVAGTSTNPIAFSNSLNIPSGTVYAINNDTGISRTAAATIAIGNGTAANASGTIVAASLTGLTGQITPNAAGGIAVGTTTLPFSSLWLGSTSAHNVQITGTFTGNRVWTIPDVTDTATGIAAAQTLTNKTLTSPVINGTPSGTGIPTATVVQGSGSGNYSSTSTSYTNVDGTNLTYTVTIPTGWKLMIWAAADAGVLTAAVAVYVAISDGGTPLTECEILPQAVIGTSIKRAALVDMVVGDGNPHTITLQYKTSNAADAVELLNTSATLTPHMTFLLTPSN